MERQIITWEGNTVGEIEWMRDAHGAVIAIHCCNPAPDLVLRCYAVCTNGTELIGLPAPSGDALALRRRLSVETLQKMGAEHDLPKAFFLATAPAERLSEKNQQSSQPVIADVTLTALLSKQRIQYAETGGEPTLSCCFLSNRPFALAPYFLSCRVHGSDAFLKMKKDAENILHP